MSLLYIVWELMELSIYLFENVEGSSILLWEIMERKIPSSLALQKLMLGKLQYRHASVSEFHGFATINQ